jgi:Ferritin-like domain
MGSTWTVLLLGDEWQHYAERGMSDARPEIIFRRCIHRLGAAVMQAFHPSIHFPKETSMQESMSRRSLLGGARAIALSAGAIALLGDREALAARKKSSSDDVAILGVALALEHEAIAAYQIGAESGLLQKTVADVAIAFQAHHKAHRDALAATIAKLGGQAAAARPTAEYLASPKLDIASIMDQTDVLKLAQRLELGAVNAYLGVIPAFGDRELAGIAGRLAADETMHYTALTQALGAMLPANALSYGA